MAKKCEELDLIAVWDEDKHIFTLRCKTDTRVPFASEDCGQFADNEKVDINQVAAELASGTRNESE